MTAGDSYDRLDDDDYPACTMGRAAEMLGTTQGFLRAIGEAGLITPLRSEGGHRRYSRYQLRIAARARELVDHGAGRGERARVVRAFAGAVLGPGHPCGDDAVLPASELFGNSVRHSSSGFPGGDGHGNGDSLHRYCPGWRSLTAAVPGCQS